MALLICCQSPPKRKAHGLSSDAHRIGDRNIHEPVVSWMLGNREVVYPASDAKAVQRVHQMIPIPSGFRLDPDGVQMESVARARGGGRGPLKARRPWKHFIVTVPLLLPDG